jgi:hypothetical protein
LENKVTIFKTYIYLLKDLIKISFIEFLPSKLLICFYSPIMGNLLRQNKYTEPVFKRKKYLSRGLDEKSFSVLIEMKSLILEFNKSRIQKGSQEKFESEIITQDKKKSKALIVIPKGWLNSESVEGRTQGLQIKFLIEGLRNIGFDISVFEVSKRNCDRQRREKSRRDTRRGKYFLCQRNRHSVRRRRAGALPHHRCKTVIRCGKSTS